MDQFTFNRFETEWLRKYANLTYRQIDDLQLSIRLAEKNTEGGWKNPETHEKAYRYMRSVRAEKLGDKLFGSWRLRYTTEPGSWRGPGPSIKTPNRDQIIRGLQRQAPYVRSEGLLNYDPPPQIGKGPTGQRGILEVDLEEMRESPEERKKKEKKARSDIRKKFNLRGAPLQQSYTSIIGGPYRRRSLAERMRDILE